jgi:branched-chain amino acid transport system substrate-binding protein
MGQLPTSKCAAVTRSGGKSWFSLTADYTFGHSLEAETTAIVNQSGGKVIGSVRHPLAATDFSRTADI